MAIKPIDLQVNFSQMNHVGRDQAASKNAELHQQAVAGQEIAQQSVEVDSKIQKSEKTGGGPEGVKDHEEREESSGEEESRQQEETPEEQTQKKRDEDLFDDPALGRHIDLSG